MTNVSALLLLLLLLVESETSIIMHFYSSQECCHSSFEVLTDLCLICQIETGEKLTEKPKSSSYAQNFKNSWYAT